MVDTTEVKQAPETPGLRPASIVPGCIAKPTIAAVCAWAGGIYLIQRDYGGGSRVAGALLIALATLLSLPVGMILFGLVVKYYFEKKIHRPLEEVLGPARKQLQQNKSLYGEPHEHRAATDADFLAIDRNWYESKTKELTGLGYTHLGDVVNKTIEKIFGVTTVSRFLTSADGTTMAIVYHVVLPAGAGRSEAKAFFVNEFETEFDDCTFILTSNSAESALATSPPSILQRRQPADTSLAELTQYHELEKSAVLATKQSVNYVKIGSLQDALESTRREQVIKNAFRKGIGYIDPEEVRRIAKHVRPGDEAGQAIAVAAVDIARSEEQRRANPAQQSGE